MERNPRVYMSMRDYRNQWMSSPYGSAYNHSWGNHTNSSDIGAVVCLWEKKEAIPLLLTKEAVEEHKENNLPLPPTDSVNILPSPASQSQPKTPQAPTTKATPSLLVLQNIRKLVATIQASATTPKTQAAAYIAWHSGWFGCRFGFRASEPRHF